MRVYLPLYLGFVLLLSSCVHDAIEVDELDATLEKAIERSSPDGTIEYYRLPHSQDLASIPQDPRNPLTPEKVELGRMLFFETGLGMEPNQVSGMQTYSCASCHVPAADFKPGRHQGIGDGGEGFGVKGERRVKRFDYEEQQLDVQGIRPLTVLNVAWAAENTLWNGSFGSGGANEGTEDIWGVHDPATEINHLGYQGLETQNIEGLKIHRLVVNKEVTDELNYTPFFNNVFPDFPEEERYTRETASLAISAYLRSLTTSEAPFQKWVRGNTKAMSDKEKRGAIVFFTDANCTSCHTSPAFNATAFFALGVYDLSDQVSFKEDDETKKKNLGRGGFTGREEDRYKFKVPTLYNLQNTPFYFHGSSKRSIREVVDYFNEAIPENPNVPVEQIASNFKPLYLSEQELADLTAFLEYSLQDETVVKYAPTSLPSGFCFPNNDELSRYQIGCD